MIKKSLATLMALFVLLVTPATLVQANADSAPTRTETFYDALFMPKDYIYFGEINNIDYFVSSTEQYYADQEADIPAELADFMYNRLPAIAAEFNTVVGNITGSGIDSSIIANDYKTYYTALVKYYFAVYNEFAALCNNPDNQIPRDVVANYANLLSTISSIFYNNFSLHYTADAGKLRIEQIYDEVYGELSAVYGDGAQAQKEAYTILKNAVLDWIKEVDIDYINAYQGQVNQYLDMVNTAGWKYDPESDTSVPSETPNSREITLSDMHRVQLIYLQENFHNMMLNADRTAFLSPEEAYASEGFQAYVYSVTQQFEYVEEQQDFSKTIAIDAIRSVLEAQYNAMYMPGAYGQPIVMVLPSFLSNTLSNYAYGIGPDKLPILESWIAPATGETPHDTYRSLNYIKAPQVIFTTALEKQVTRTIQYVFSDGTTAAADVVQTTTFTGEKSEITGISTWSEASAVLPALENPAVAHPDSRYIVGTPAEVVEEWTVDPDTGDIVLTVVYPLTLVDDSSASSSTSSQPPASSSSSTEQPATPSTSNAGTTPQTGDSNIIYGLVAFFLVSAAAIVGILIYSKQKKKETDK